MARNKDRLARNQWTAAPAATQKSQQEQVVDSSLIRSMYQYGNGRMVHQFKYRTYSNFEEAGAICKPLRRLGLVFRKPGELEFLRPTQTRTTDEDEDVPVLALVVNTEAFSLGIFLSLKIQWRGHVIQRGANASANANTKQIQN